MLSSSVEWSPLRAVLVTSLYIGSQHEMMASVELFNDFCVIQGNEMLFTDANWAESNASRNAIAKPYQPWRCVGWTDEDVCFWVFPEQDADQSVDLPDGLMVVGPEVLLDVIAQMPADGFSVYVMEVGSQGREPELKRLTGLYSQPDVSAGALDYWYRTGVDDLRPCSTLQSTRNEGPLKLVFAGNSRDFCVA